MLIIYDKNKFFSQILYITIFIGVVISISLTYKSVFIEKKFNIFTQEDQIPDPLNKFIDFVNN